MSTDDRARAWDDLALQSYQKRLLSKDADRFPALSGLATRFQTAGLGKYVAGIWSNYALSMLLWEVKIGRKSTTYVAPSWSWASIQGTLTRNEMVVHNDDFIARLEDIWCATNPLQPFGALQEATITIRTPAVDGVLSTGGHHSDTMVLLNKKIRAFFVKDSPDDENLFGTKVKCLFLRGLETTGRYVEALVLTHTADPSLFQRIGIAHLTKASHSYLDTLDLQEEKITIV